MNALNSLQYPSYTAPPSTGHSTGLALPLFTSSRVNRVLWEPRRDTERTCLCLGSLEQMTNTVPCLLTNEHPSQYFLIALRTFIPLLPMTLTAPVTPVAEDETRSGEEWSQEGVHLWAWAGEVENGRLVDGRAGAGEVEGAALHLAQVQALGWLGEVICENARTLGAGTPGRLGPGVVDGAALHLAHVHALGWFGELICEKALTPFEGMSPGRLGPGAVLGAALHLAHVQALGWLGDAIWEKARGRGDVAG